VNDRKVNDPKINDKIYQIDRQGISDNEVAVETFLQVSRNQLVTPRFAQKMDL